MRRFIPLIRICLNIWYLSHKANERNKVTNQCRYSDLLKENKKILKKEIESTFLGIPNCLINCINKNCYLYYLHEFENCNICYITHLK